MFPRLFVICSFLTLGACGSSEPTDTTPPTPPEPTTEAPAEPTTEAPTELPDQQPAERPTMTVEECEAAGTVVGDIGDGAVHRPDYRCPNGEAPIGTVPSGIEGSVCCPK